MSEDYFRALEIVREGWPPSGLGEDVPTLSLAELVKLSDEVRIPISKLAFYFYFEYHGGMAR